MFKRKQALDVSVLPRHIGVIMDGNGRWAQRRGLPRTAGHAAGFLAFREITRYCNKIGIEALTVYTLSTENWSRPQQEIDGILELLRENLRDSKNFLSENIRTRFIGDLSRFPEDIRQLIASDTVEIQNHSYDLHKKGPRIGADRKKGEAMEDYERILGEDITTYRRLMDEKTGYTAAAFAYPLGEYSKSSEEVLKKQGFSATMTCREKINTITRDPDCLFGLGRFNRPGGVGTERFFERVLKGH